MEIPEMSNMRPEIIRNKRKNLGLDPELDKEVYKERITRSILEQVAGADREEVYRKVSEDYERLLHCASIKMHIPVLVEGEVRAEERRKRQRVS